MVSAKFHIIGEDSEWLRIRLQEEIHAHGVEGNVILAGEKTLVVVVDGDKSRIKRLHTDVGEFLPGGIEPTELIFSLEKPPRHLRMTKPEGRVDNPALDYILQYLREIEKTVTRIDQKVGTLIAVHEGYAGSEVVKPAAAAGTFEGKDMEVEEEAAGGFAAMFGE